MMREFFKPWRRKIGVAKLVMACVLTLGWVRSLYIFDSVNIPRSDSIHAIESGWGMIAWGRVSPNPAPASVSTWNSRKTESEPRNKTAWKDCDVIWAFDFGDFHFGVATKKPAFTLPRFSPMRIGVWAIPYWIIVLPLTLLSAYLLISKPRVAKPPAVTEK